MLLDLYWALWDLFIWWFLAPIIAITVVAVVVEAFFQNPKGKP
jgi:hypothetical protein